MSACAGKGDLREQSPEVLEGQHQGTVWFLLSSKPGLGMSEGELSPGSLHYFCPQGPCIWEKEFCPRTCLWQVFLLP